MDKGGIILIKEVLSYALLQFTARFDGDQIHHFVYITASKRPGYKALYDNQKNPPANQTLTEGPDG